MLLNRRVMFTFRIIVVWLLCILLEWSTGERCIKYQNVSNIVFVNNSSQTTFTVYPWGEKIDTDSVIIDHPNWRPVEIDDFILPTRITESNPLKIERLAIPLMQIIENNLQDLKKYQNYLYIEKINNTTIHLFEKEWSEYRSNYKLIINEKTEVLKCRTVYDCEPLQDCKIEYLSDIFQDTYISNIIYLQWKEINRTVSIGLQIKNLLLSCQDQSDALRIDNIQIRSENLQKYRKGMYSFIETNWPQSCKFEPNFNLQQNQYVHLLVALCTLCTIDVKLINNTIVVDEIYLDGNNYKNQNKLKWQHVYLTTLENCSECFIRIDTNSNERLPFWIITKELQIGRINNTEFVTSNRVSLNLIRSSNTLQNSLQQRFVNSFNGTLVCELNNGKTNCRRPDKHTYSFRIIIDLGSPIVVKWCEDSPDLPDEYHIIVFNTPVFKMNDYVLEKWKIVDKTAQFDNNCFLEPLLHLKPKTIYGIVIFSSVSEGTELFTTP